MYNKFQEYYKLSNSEFKKLWDSAIFIFDTNTLLNFYRYSENTVKVFFDILEKIKERVWIPFQIGKEFHDDRLSVINQQAKIYYESSLKIKDIYDTLISDSRNPFLSQTLQDEFSLILEKVTKDLDEKMQIFNDKIIDDNVLSRITVLFENKVGNNFSDEKLKDIYSKGIKRYADKIPPGYQDKSKPEPNKFGDLVIWNQILDYAKEKNLPVIFISDDRKEDWWLLNSGKVIGPRPELRKEFYDTVNNQFYMYQPFKFLEYANNYIEIKIKQDTIDEVKDLKPYNEEILKTSIKNDILISILLETNSKSNIVGFIELLKSSGYEVYNEAVDNNKAILYVPLPNIPDLKRRIQSRFMTQLVDYDLKLIEFKPQGDE
ncbi:MAG: DUF4935 domain-containing protein [Ignavibacteriales bacterium]|nr:DUF4935 domain-containing protein [Ignavibacteriales bacterium]